MAYDFSPSEDATISIYLEDAGEPLTSATVTVTVVGPTGTTIASAAAASHRGAGVYVYTVTASNLALEGTYAVTWTVTSPTNLVRKTAFSVGWNDQSDLTLLDARHAVALDMDGEDYFVTGIVDSSTSTAIVDASRVEPDNYFRGCWFHIYYGTGEGTIRRITASDQSSTNLTFAEPMSTLPDTTSRYEILKTFKPETINDAIRRAVRESAKFCFKRVEATTTLVSDQYEYSLPAYMAGVYAVEILVDPDNDLYVPIVPALWKLVSGQRKLKLDYRVITSWPGYGVRILGLRAPTEPTTDASVIDAPFEFVVNYAAGLLAKSKQTGRDNDVAGWRMRMESFFSLAETAKRDHPTRVPNNYKRVG